MYLGRTWAAAFEFILQTRMPFEVFTITTIGWHSAHPLQTWTLKTTVNNAVVMLDAPPGDRRKRRRRKATGPLWITWKIRQWSTIYNEVWTEEVITYLGERKPDSNLTADAVNYEITHFGLDQLPSSVATHTGLGFDDPLQ